MSNLQDQLLKAGLVSGKKAKQIKKEKTRKTKAERKSSQPVVDENKEQALQAMKDKAERDRELNAQRNAEAEKKAIAAQIKQLIHVNKVHCSGDLTFNFTDGSKVKKLYVSDKLQNELSRGLLAIVSAGQGYELVPGKVADKIAQRDEQAVVFRAEMSQTEKDEDDPYADYEIPDDLMW